MTFSFWLGGKRIASDGQIETLSGQELQDLDARLRPHMNEDADYAWLLLINGGRATGRSYDATTQEQAADLIIRPKMNEYEGRHASCAAPIAPIQEAF